MINPPQVRPEEPTAVTPHGGICGGISQQWLSYPTKPHAGICGGGAGYPAPLPDKSPLDRRISFSAIALRITGSLRFGVTRRPPCPTSRQRQKFATGPFRLHRPSPCHGEFRDRESRYPTQYNALLG